MFDVSVPSLVVGPKGVLAVDDLQSGEDASQLRYLMLLLSSGSGAAAACDCADITASTSAAESAFARQVLSLAGEGASVSPQAIVPCWNRYHAVADLLSLDLPTLTRHLRDGTLAPATLASNPGLSNSRGTCELTHAELHKLFTARFSEQQLRAEETLMLLRKVFQA
jgi:hypothetical protein